jgi:hypothetical protein
VACLRDQSANQSGTADCGRWWRLRCLTRFAALKRGPSTGSFFTFCRNCYMTNKKTRTNKTKRTCLHALVVSRLCWSWASLIFRLSSL